VMNISIPGMKKLVRRMGGKIFEDVFPLYIDLKNFNVIFMYHRVMMVKGLIGIQ
jgi:hypothetical protein